MNTQEINETIARAKGLKALITKDGNVLATTSGSIWVDTGKKLPTTIDYTTDPKLILELALELKKSEWDDCWFNNAWEWECNKETCIVISNTDYGIATDLAWIEEFTK